ncbi:MAG TPA: DUF1236 domain-containing protein [Xanthobacteraceae bacterium]|jgi:hypothetical protein|nr:DUF1236 domain-containing protein [Xanthobacteraceae bacterium]
MKPFKFIATVATVTMLGIGGSLAQTAVQPAHPAPGGPGSDAGIGGAIEQKPLLSPDQRKAIYAEVSKDKSKTSPKDFSPVVGADVPPMIELYMLPDDAVAQVPSAKLYKYTMVEDRVVVVDPTKMRVIDVIGP